MIAFTDSKVQELVSKAGMEGYGAYCVIVDCLVSKGRSTFDAEARKQRMAEMGRKSGEARRKGASK